ncbi:helix-turn-helix domain-containing protein [Nonomuraea sp. NEAU-A123]|uniref:helix-turn-helix domain-containing protein n=1 Tax=Nonomuraea sp. NEAU-A123 TaxID=2839649 RepID=UPI001BE3DDCD|nr:helix-turn-helix domain-containing protein [Nonomuraea sp. NEAU-A123]MBT2235390.1 helix-turn-helix domain-containing protein [Nonomuraea sp. NEAU-A123]
MRGLLLRLSTLDTDAESAVRVIAYFDSLVRDHVSVPVLLSAAARLTQCPVGLLDATTGRRTRTFPNGHVDHPGTDQPAVRELASGLGAVWMERDGIPHGLDEIVLERLAAAAEVTLERAVALAREGRDPALVELALSAETGEAERARALRLLGFDPATPLQALAIAIPADEGFALVPGVRTLGHHVRAARIGDTEAALVATALPRLPDSARVGIGPELPDSARIGIGPELPDSARIGIGPELPVSARIGIGPELPGSRVAESWAGARTALRFTGPHDRVVRWTELGALALYADVPDAAIAELADVRSMERLGGEAQAAVRALCAEGSVRRSATVLHLHHSSMAARIARAESVLGFSLADSAGRLRAHLALALVRLRANGGSPA